MSREAGKYFEEVSGRWDILRKSFYRDEIRDAVLSAARLLPKSTVLDVGAGTGFLTEGAAKIGNVEQIPLPNASVDAVIGNMVLHHCPSPEAAVREMGRGLVPGGRLVLSDLRA